MITRVALLIESSRGYGRGLLRGIGAYARTHGSWSIYRHERSLGDAIPGWFRHWRGEGVIARVESKKLADEIERRGIPTVDLRGRYSLEQVPVIETNDLAVVRMACDHLIECGLKNIAFCGFEGANYSDRRKALATEYLAEFGISLAIQDCPISRCTDTSNIEAEGMLDEAGLGEWLLSLPKPIGLLACNDTRAAQVLGVCREVEISVPDDMAVIGVDNDELICDLTDPPLTSIANDTYRIGYKACEQLSQMIAGELPPSERILVTPLGVFERRSTFILAIEDPDIAAAVRFIRDHACEGISVDDIAEAIQVSRSTLDRRFTKIVGRSPKTEINRVRVKRVKQLLVDTEYKLSVIASLTGFAHTEYLSTMFKEHTGDTPGRYRETHQEMARKRANSY